MAGTQIHGPSFSAFPTAWAGSWMRSTGVGIKVALQYGMWMCQAVVYPIKPQCLSHVLNSLLSHFLYHWSHEIIFFLILSFIDKIRTVSSTLFNYKDFLKTALGKLDNDLKHLTKIVKALFISNSTYAQKNTYFPLRNLYFKPLNWLLNQPQKVKWGSGILLMFMCISIYLFPSTKV